MRQYIVDAFADMLFGGNPAAVCVPDGFPPEETMQLIASENNLSETAFVVREGEGYAIRWFTPAGEINLCGHALLASAFVLSRYGAADGPCSENPLLFHSRSGVLPVYREGKGFTLDLPSLPAAPAAALPEAEAALGAAVEEWYLGRDLVAVVDSEETVRGLSPDFLRMRGLPVGDGVIVTAPGESCDFVSRCFYPRCGVNEDPVTGSAHCNLIPYWSARLGKKRMTARQLSPRGGTLRCEDRGERVRVTGRAVLFSVADISL